MKIRASLLAGGFLVLVSLPVTVLAGGHGGPRGGQRFQSMSHTSSSNHGQFGQQLHDGSHADQTMMGIDAMQKKGNAYGPGEGSGPGHQTDDSGYGAHTNR